MFLSQFYNNFARYVKSWFYDITTFVCILNCKIVFYIFWWERFLDRYFAFTKNEQNVYCWGSG